VSRKAFLEITPIGKIQEFLFDSRDPSRNMKPIQTMLAFLPKPGVYHSSQSVFTIRQDPQIRVLSSTALKGQYSFHMDKLTATMQIAERIHSLAREQNNDELMVAANKGLIALFLRTTRENIVLSPLDVD
jgi:hypothetical protein